MSREPTDGGGGVFEIEVVGWVKDAEGEGKQRTGRRGERSDASNEEEERSEGETEERDKTNLA